HQRGASLPPAFEAYLLSMLAKQPEDRPTARQAADWFAGGAWRGAPEPLPPEQPAGVMSSHGRGPEQSSGSRSGSRAGGQGRRRAPEHRSTGAAHRRSTPAPAAPRPVSVTTEDGWNTSVHRVPPRRPGLRSLLRRHFRVAAAVGGTALFLLALFLGMAFF